MSGPGIVLPLATLAVALLMVATWAEGVRREDISIVDPVGARRSCSWRWWGRWPAAAIPRGGGCCLR